MIIGLKDAAGKIKVTFNPKNHGSKERPTTLNKPLLRDVSLPAKGAIILPDLEEE